MKRQITNRDVENPAELRKRLQSAYDDLYDLLGKFEGLRATVIEMKGGGSGLTRDERRLLQSLSIGSTENPVAAQKPVIPTVDELPPFSNSTDGELVRFGGVVYVFDESTSSWTSIIAAASAHDLLSATHGDTLASAVSRGSLIVGNSTPKWAELNLGTANQLLRVNAGGTDPEWGAVPDAALSSNVPLKNAASNVFTGDMTVDDLTADQIAITTFQVAGGATFGFFQGFGAGLTPAAVAANTTSEQAFGGFTGAQVGYHVIVNKPTHQAGLGIVGARVSAADTVAITFGNFTAAAITPTAAETYRVLIVG